MMAALEQEKGATELSQFEKSRQRGELHEKWVQQKKMQQKIFLNNFSKDWDSSC